MSVRKHPWRIEYLYEDETTTWHARLPGAFATRANALKRVIDIQERGAAWSEHTAFSVVNVEGAGE